MKKFEVLWTKSAKCDLELIVEYIKLDSFATAREIFFGIKKECESLYYFPKRKRVVVELAQIGILHKLRLKSQFQRKINQKTNINSFSFNTK